jgi:glycine betaine/choline ABC-type transport system substrate-binding protein
MRNFPALPRVVNKLASAIKPDALTSMVTQVSSGEAPKQVARDFLRRKRLI